MAKTTLPNSGSPRDTQTAAVEVGCNVNTLRNYVRAGDVVPPRTPSGRFCWFDEQISRARQIYNASRDRRG